MRKIIVTGFLKTITPLHITAPSSDRFDPATGEKAFVGSDVGVPCTSIQTLGIPTIAERKPKEGEEGVAEKYSTIRRIPAISGNNPAGHIRRHVANVFLEALRDKGQQVAITSYSAIKCGAATGQPDGAPVSYDEYKKAEQHPFLGLMGGGPRLVKRKAKVWNMMSLCKESLNILNRSRIPYINIYETWDNLLAEMGAGVSYTSQRAVWGYRRNDDLKTLADIASAEQSIINFKQAFEERQARIIDDFKNGKGEGGKTGLDTYQGLEFVLPDVAFPFVAVLENSTDAQAGLWLRGFERFICEDALGGWSRNGFGEFSFERGMITVVEDGEIVSTEKYDPTTKQGGEAHLQSVRAWLAAAEEVTGSEIDELLRLAAEKPKKGKAKEAAAA